MKNKIFMLFTIISVTLSMVGCSVKTKEVIKHCDGNRSLFLVAGFDDAAENTDVLFTLGYDSSTDTAYVAQIPRDTYFNFGKQQNKINQIYASARAEGMSPEAAMKYTSETISEAFGTEFDGFAAIGISTFVSMVDAIGGIDIDLSDDMNISADEEKLVILKKGHNHIDGETAEQLVRFRSGYAMGDLGRIDAQKIFLNALFKKISGGLTLLDLVRLANTFYNDVVTDIKLSDAIQTLSGGLSKKGDKTVMYATVPGEPVNYKNVSFYILNRKSAAEIAERYMFSENDFDADTRFCNCTDQISKDIYYDDGIAIREYISDRIGEIKITSKRN